MRQALGRGLDALIPPPPKPALPAELRVTAPGPLLVPLSKIRPNRLQPRRHFDPEKLAELSASIKEHGLAQPIVASYDSASDTYELIAGERRLRASELAGVKEVEVVVKTPQNDPAMALAISETFSAKISTPLRKPWVICGS